MSKPSTDRLDGIGLLAGVGSYLSWGLVPIYFRAVKSVPVLELLAHRAVWVLVFLAVWIALSRRWPLVRAAWASRRVRYGLALTSLLIGVNWLLYTWAATSGQVIQGSLGYFINPLLSVLLGFTFLRERPRRIQWGAIALAGAGVAILVIVEGQVPYLALSLALTFGLYGLLRKQIPVDSICGLAIETAIIAPIALGAIGYWAARGELAFLHQSASIDVLLLLAGVVTGLPLVMFGVAARRLPLTVLGLLQYISPSLQFLVGLAAGEAMSPVKWTSFAFIWAGLVVFTADLLLRQARAAPAAPIRAATPVSERVAAPRR
jgi:chloramphenicol-sensitive protein RarD